MTRLLIISSEERVRDQVIATCGELDGIDIVGTVASAEGLQPRLAAEEQIDMVLLDEGFDDGDGLEVARQLSVANPLLGIIILVSKSSPETMQAAMNAGARSVLALPPSFEEFRARIDSVGEWARSARRQLSPDAQGADSGGRVIAMVGAKGGVGTSTLSLLLGRASAEAGTVCVVDLDVRNGDLAAYSGVAIRRSITDLVEIADEISGRALGETTYQIPHGIRLLPAPLDSEEGEGLTAFAVRQILSALRYQYATVIVDCGSRLDESMAMALEVSDAIVIVATPDAPAFRSARRLVDSMERLEISPRSKCRLLVNRSSRSSDVQPSLGPKVAGIPLVGVAPEAGTPLETAMNTAKVLEPAFPQFDPACEAIRSFAGLSTPRPATAARGSRRRRARKAADHEAGQVLVETPLVMAMAVFVILVCVQMVLWGVSHLVSVNAAQEAARSFAIGNSSATVQHDVDAGIPSGWSNGWSMSRSGSEVSVSVSTPSLIPALIPAVSSSASILEEE